MASKKKVTEGLREIGACWAVRTTKFVDPNDNWRMDGRPVAATYHIHPDAEAPEQSAVLRFRTLKEIEEYIEARRRAKALWDALDKRWGGDYDYDKYYAEEMDVSVAADQIMSDYWESVTY